MRTTASECQAAVDELLPASFGRRPRNVHADSFIRSCDPPRRCSGRGDRLREGLCHREPTANELVQQGVRDQLRRATALEAFGRGTVESQDRTLSPVCRRSPSGRLHRNSRHKFRSRMNLRDRVPAPAWASVRTLGLLLIVSGCGHTDPFTSPPYGTDSPFDPAPPVRLTLNPLADRGGAWVPDGSGILYSAQQIGRTDHDVCLALLSPTGGRQQALTCDLTVAGVDSTNAIESRRARRRRPARVRGGKLANRCHRHPARRDRGRPDVGPAWRHDRSADSLRDPRRARRTPT